MRKGYLSEYVDGVAAKKLSEVETNPGKSNQHEFNGVSKLFALFGEPQTADGKLRLPATFIYLTDGGEEPVTDESWLTWYDARKKGRDAGHTNRSEYRLYYPDNLVTHCASTGDLLLIIQKTDGNLLALIAEQDSTIERQLIWLFGLDDIGSRFAVRADLDNEQDRISFTNRFLLEQIGIKTETELTAYLAEMLEKFGGSFPKATEFSAYARSTLSEVSLRDDIDGALMAWMEREETLFRTLEKHLLTKRLNELIQQSIDTDNFLALAQSTLQRRKSRAGAALENHLEYIFTELGIRHTRGGIIEGRLKPDFIFPSISDYHNPQFPNQCLTMLAAKTTCKDRWRQILNEATRIQSKHLITLEPGISESQTDEMQQAKVQLVLPRSLYDSYTERQQQQVINLWTFVGQVRTKQALEK